MSAAPEEPWTVGRLLTWTVDYLEKHGAENPRLDAEVLLAHARGCRRIDLYAAFGEPANEETRTAFRELVKRRATGTPVAYLVGHREFYSLDFEVTPDVLIPRPETESLVVALIDRAKRGEGRGARSEEQGARSEEQGARNEEQGARNEERGARSEREDAGEISVDAEDRQPPVPSPKPPLFIADVGTGSGILAICAAKYLPTAHVTAIDISAAALAVARRNAEKHGVADRLTFVEANLLSKEPEEPRFDFIMSNPPYVSAAEMAELATDVRDHEPHTALLGGEAGTEIVAELIRQAAPRLKPGGILLIEISPMIAAAVEQLLDQQPVLERGPTIRDLAGHARVVQATRRMH